MRKRIKKVKMLLSRYLISFFLTLIIEIAVALAFGYREKKFLVTILLVNVVTHPLLHYVLKIGRAHV